MTKLATILVPAFLLLGCPRERAADSTAGSAGELAALRAQVDALTSAVERLEARSDRPSTDPRHNPHALGENAGDFATDAEDIAGGAGYSEFDLLHDLATYLSVDTATHEVVFSGANVHVRSGSGATDDDGSLSGLGNLIVGYDEGGDVKTGSHNLVVGAEHTYDSYGGLVAGYDNSITGAYSSVTGGRGNRASGGQASISGGQDNAATGIYASVSGGYQNDATGEGASVGGGWANGGLGRYSFVGSGYDNQAHGLCSSIAGGLYGDADAEYSAVLGGVRSAASGVAASVVGGVDNTASGYYSAVLGGHENDSSSSYSTVSGGDGNEASGLYSSVSGGKEGQADGDHAWVGGGRGAAAGPPGSAVTGGWFPARGWGYHVLPVI